MTASAPAADGIVPQQPARQLDVVIRSGLILVLAVLCYQVFAPFLSLLVWAMILAISLYPLQQRLARRLGGRQGLASALLVVGSIVGILLPSALLMTSCGETVRLGIQAVQENRVHLPPPRESVRKWPVVGPKLHDLWTRAHQDLPAFVQSLQPQIGGIAKSLLGAVAGIGLGLLLFLAALVVSGILMAHGEAGTRGARSVFIRIAGPERGEHLARLSTATIRTVAQGILGVAFIQALLIGVVLLVAGIPGAGFLSVLALVLAIAQIPTLLITLPAAAYLWMGGHHGTVAAVFYTIVLLVAGVLDNVLKPLLLGRGVDAPMPVVLLGALGGMAAGGLLGMFVGATLLTLGYRLFMGWVGEASPPPVPAP